MNNKTERLQKIIYVILIICIGYNVFIPSYSETQRKLALVNEYVLLPINNKSVVIVPETNRIPEFYLKFRSENFSIEEYLNKIEALGWRKAKEVRKEGRVTYYTYCKKYYIYIIRVYDNGDWGDSLYVES